MEIRFLGHACFELSEGDTRVLIDPFLTGNPKGAVEASELNPTQIFLTHGHQDHYGDIVEIAKRTGAQCVAIVEIAGELEGKGVENVANPNIGGTVEFDGGWVRLGPPWDPPAPAGGPRAHPPAPAGGRRADPRRPGDQPRRQDRLPPRRHRPLLGPPAREGPRRH